MTPLCKCGHGEKDHVALSGNVGCTGVDLLGRCPCASWRPPEDEPEEVALPPRGADVIPIRR